MSKRTIFVLGLGGAVCASVIVVLIVLNRGEGNGLAPSRIANTPVEKIGVAKLPGRKEVGRGVLTEEQQRHLFREMSGFDLPAHALDFDGNYYHDYDPREKQYFLSHAGYCSLPVDEGMELLDRVEEVWRARGGGDNEELNYLRRRNQFVELAPKVGDPFPVGSPRVSFSDIAGRNESYMVIINPHTGRLRFGRVYRGR